jgi:hypothetical protein
MASSTRPLKYIQPYQISSNFTQGKYYFESFKGGEQPFFYKIASALPALPTANQGDTSHVLTPGGFYWQFFETTAQTLFPTGSAGNGLNISCDLVDNEALEIVPGGNSANSKLKFKIGTDTDFFFRCKFKWTDVSGSDQAVIGFRKQEAFAVPTSILTTGDGIYTDFFGIGFADTGGVDIYTVSDLNNGGSTTATDTGFNATDAEVIELQVRVIGGKAFGYINGVRLGGTVSTDGDGTAITAQNTTSTPSFTFDAADTLVPFIFLRHDADVAEAVYLQEIECGHLVDIGLDPNQE